MLVIDFGLLVRVFQSEECIKWRDNAYVKDGTKDRSTKDRSTDLCCKR